MRIVVDENIPGAEQAFGHLGDVRRLSGRSLHRADLKDADALVVRSVTQVGRELLQDTPVRFVGTATIGVDHVDRAYLAEKGIGFANAAGCNARAVVEYVIAALLEIAVARGEGLEGKTLGIIGHGNIGSRLARTAPALGLRVVVNDPPLQRTGHAGPLVSLTEVLSQSDFVTLHVPKVTSGPDRTIGLMDVHQLARMKSTAWLINSSRGDVIVGRDLGEALAQKHIAGAVLDVWENEPVIDRALMDMVFLATPHIAGYSLEGKINGTTMMHDALVAHFGLSNNWQPEMPSPENATIEVDHDKGALEEEILARVVRRSYSIRQDDERLRAGQDPEPAQWRLHFDRLRRDYPVRREFANYRVAIHGESAQLARKIEGLGFLIQRRT